MGQITINKKPSFNEVENGVVSNVTSMSLVHVPNSKELYRYTAILIYS